MTKMVLNPRCEFAARGSSEEEVLRAAAEHAKSQHGMSDVPPDLLSKACRFIHDEDAGSDQVSY
jgi:predicted small metal-binding protein